MIMVDCNKMNYHRPPDCASLPHVEGPLISTHVFLVGDVWMQYILMYSPPLHFVYLCSLDAAWATILHFIEHFDTLMSLSLSLCAC